jgi:hypothetical protein
LALNREVKTNDGGCLRGVTESYFLGCCLQSGCSKQLFDLSKNGCDLNEGRGDSGEWVGLAQGDDCRVLAAHMIKPVFTRDDRWSSDLHRCSHGTCGQEDERSEELHVEFWLGEEVEVVVLRIEERFLLLKKL